MNVNSRERQRMHDINSAMDRLREVMPCAKSPNVKKMSKMSTLIFARNYITTLHASLEEMKKLVKELSYNKPTQMICKPNSRSKPYRDSLYRPYSSVVSRPTHHVQNRPLSYPLPQPLFDSVFTLHRPYSAAMRSPHVGHFQLPCDCATCRFPDVTLENAKLLDLSR